MRILITGGTGVLGRNLIPLLRAGGHEVIAPSHHELDLFDPRSTRIAAERADVLIHLATRIPPPERASDGDAWRENDRLRSESTGLLVEAAVAGGADAFLLPSVAFVYPEEGPFVEDTPLAGAPARLRSMLVAEKAVQGFGQKGGRGIVLRLGLLWGPGTGNDAPNLRYGAALHVEDAGLALAAALEIDSGVYNVVADGEKVPNERFKAATGWQPRY